MRGGRLALVAASVCVLVWCVALAGPRDADWAKVDEAIRKGLPRTAIEHLEPIIEAAMRDKQYAEAIKAIAKKISLQAAIEGNKPEVKIRLLSEELKKAPAPMKPVMETILAHWYWQYFQQNRWRFLQRTQLEGPESDDFTTWSLPRLFREIDRHFQAALASADELKKVPIQRYDDLLIRGTVPDKYRPTLFDFLAYEALQFYQAGEQGGARPEDAFDLRADSPIFSDVETFLNWKVEASPEQSLLVRAIHLYQELLRFHRDDDDRSAFLDANLARLRFGFDHAFGEEKNARYKAALKRFVENWPDHEVTARAYFEWASVLHQEGDWVAARKIALQAANRFPDTPGGAKCFNLVGQIEMPSLAIHTERVWNDPLPAIAVRYRNLTAVHFRLVAYRWEQLLDRRTGQPEYLQQKEVRELIGRKPVREWSVTLPETAHYHERTEKTEAPEDLSPGFYFLLASNDPQFQDGANKVVAYAPVWVSRLAVVTRSEWGSAKVEGFVLDNRTGEPLVGATVRTYRWARTRWVAAGAGKTDTNGLFRLSLIPHTPHVFLAEHDGHRLATMYALSVYGRSPTERSFEQTRFFTDRSLYRPGQIVRYKGICISVDHARDNYTTIADRTVTVALFDRNGKQVESHKHRTNAFGSFSGSFTAPRDRGTGQFTIRITDGPNGMTAVRVEEYKRPKFEVELHAPKEAPRLNREVVLQGKATAYTGAPIGGAKVRYRVVRRVRYPIWWSWYFWWRTPVRESQEIAHGTTTTAADGTFTIRFVAKPDPSVSEEEEPVFHFAVTAEVTDISGETRSDSRTVAVGYTALQASLQIAEWQTVREPVKISIHTSSLDSEPQPAEGTLRVFALRQPEKVQRPDWLPQVPGPPVLYRRGRLVAPPPRQDDPNSWPAGEVVFERKVSTGSDGAAVVDVALKVGAYRAVFETRDRFGKPVTAKAPIRVLDPDASRLAIRVPEIVAAPRWSVDPKDEQFVAVWGSGYDKARAFIEIEHRGKRLQAYWTDPKRTQVQIRQQVDESMRGGFTLRITFVRENRPYLTQRHVDVPWSNKNLTIQWERFVSKLEPGQKEKWVAIIKGPDAERAVAEMVATLYDASLDAYYPHHWMTYFGVFRQDYSRLSSQFHNAAWPLHQILGAYQARARAVPSWQYRRFPPDIIGGVFFQGRRFFAPGAPMMARKAMANAAAPAEAALAADAGALEGAADKKAADRQAVEQQAEQPPAPKVDLESVQARRNLNETAFFFPHLKSDEDGKVTLEFTMPEALTRWKFMGFAHDAKLRAGFLQDTVVTSKDLMIQPNPPRFVREGDELEFVVKVVNRSATRQKGVVRLTFASARTGETVDAALGNTQPERSFDVPANESRVYGWRIRIPDGMEFLTYKAVGSTGRLSDGEEGYLPVLSRRILVTESLPLPIRGPATRTFRFERLLDSARSSTLRHQSLTVQVVSNPAWYGVMALPYLMEFPYECTEQTFNRLYANSLAHHIVRSDPKIERVFAQWRNTPALDSPLEKNEDLKAIALEETPWLRQAERESQARRNVGILFDDNRLTQETRALTQRLKELQRADGSWPWFPGGPPNQYITLYITTGFGRLRHLGVDVDFSAGVKALGYLDNWMRQTYEKLKHHGQLEKVNFNATIALYLYCRTFYLEDRPVEPKNREAFDYFVGQARKHWLKVPRQSQGHTALALNRLGFKDDALGIMRSLKERSVVDEEMGRFWRDLELSWWWFRAPIETQAVMIEAFDEVAGDAEAVEECKVWLLKQKQTQDWKTTKATADAVYALLLRGENWLASDELVRISLGGRLIEPEHVEAGTGFYEHRFVGPEVKPELGLIRLEKKDKGVAWASVHWQYLEDVGKVTAYEGTPLKLEKSLFVREYTKAGPVLKPLPGSLHVGDELVVRIVLRTDRDMEYVHMKDHRGSGTEPVNVLSRYRYQDGLAYYEATRDTATHFFIDYLPKGTYVFEYPLRVVHKGVYQSGMAQIQCMYAPEFNSHSGSVPLHVE
ncbi:MAG: hypothetical protein D6725_02230 [Planctomycetota bacterium]|nr:MAG: hypothetical protein D6725_02230 [Planctomycetota bacterium]